MNKNINLVELLKDCPKGTTFYSRAIGSVTFNCIKSDRVCIKNYKGIETAYTKSGKFYYAEEDAEIDLFPSKDQRDWSKWHRPFVDGDIVTNKNNGGNWIGIYHEDKHSNLSFYSYCYLRTDGTFCANSDTEHAYYGIRLATEDEKVELFQAIKDNGYKWNNTTKTLEKLIEPKFKVGDTIRSKKNSLQEYKIADVSSEYYSTEIGRSCVSLLPIKDQDDFILVPNRFDITSLQPFDKVLVRQYNVSAWGVDFYSYYDEFGGYAVCTGDVHYDFCVPYNDDTKHLVSKTEDAPEFYRYWED